jgi:hypothetical protein
LRSIDIATAYAHHGSASAASRALLLRERNDQEGVLHLRVLRDLRKGGEAEKRRKRRARRPTVVVDEDLLFGPLQDVRERTLDEDELRSFEQAKDPRKRTAAVTPARGLEHLEPAVHERGLRCLAIERHALFDLDEPIVLRDRSIGIRERDRSRLHAELLRDVLCHHELREKVPERQDLRRFRPQTISRRLIDEVFETGRELGGVSNPEPGIRKRVPSTVASTSIEPDPREGARTSTWVIVHHLTTDRGARATRNRRGQPRRPALPPVGAGVSDIGR